MLCHVGQAYYDINLEIHAITNVAFTLPIRLFVN